MKHRFERDGAFFEKTCVLCNFCNRKEHLIMKCKSCGAQMDPGDHFCRECGMPVGGGKKADNKEEGYADNILSKSGRFDAVYFVPMAILLGVLFIISSVLRMNYEKNNPVDTNETTEIESEARLESYWNEDQYWIA